jgi:hypothetical protein
MFPGRFTVMLGCKRLMKLFFSIALPIVLSLTAKGNLLFNGGFESEPNFGSGVSGDAGYSDLTGSQIPGWTIAPGRAVDMHNTVLYPTISGSYSAGTDGEGYNGHNSDFYQDFGSALGNVYTLSYDWFGWQNNASSHLDVSVTDTVTSTILYDGNFAYNAGLHHVSISFIGSGNNLRLEIKESPESGGNDNMFIVDNFDVEVPEPSTLGLMAAALGALVLGKRKLPSAA